MRHQAPPLPVPTLEGVAARMLQAADVPALRRLRDDVVATLPDPDLYVREPDEAAFITAHLGPAGQTIGLFDGPRLVGYAMLGTPAAGDPAHLAAPLGWPAPLRAVTAELASCMIAPDWRGRGLQRALIGSRLLLARALGCRHVVAIVSLHNHASRHNMMACGLQVLHTGSWHGLQRQWLGLDLAAAPPAAVAHGRLQWERADDAAAQARRSAAGERGVAERRDAASPQAAPWIGYAPHGGPS